MWLSLRRIHPWIHPFAGLLQSCSILRHQQECSPNNPPTAQMPNLPDCACASSVTCTTTCRSDVLDFFGDASSRGAFREAAWSDAPCSVPFVVWHHS